MYGLVSVIIPSYDSEKWVAAAIDSVLAQTYPTIEIIVVDDGSTDATRTLLLEKYRKQIRYQYQQNQGLAGARNTGLALANGRYIQFLDADDLLQPDKIARQIACFATHPSCAVVHSDFDYFVDGKPAVSLPSPPQFAVKRTCSDTWGSLLSGNFIVVHAPLCSREAVIAAGGFDETLSRCEDYDLWLRMAHRGHKFVYCPGTLVRYRIRKDSMSSDLGKQIQATLAILGKVPLYASLNPAQKRVHEVYIAELSEQLAALYGAYPDRSASNSRVLWRPENWIGRELRKLFEGLT